MRGPGRRRFLAQGSGALVGVLAARAVSLAERGRHVPEFRDQLTLEQKAALYARAWTLEPLLLGTECVVL
jgi:hypothetical protein